MVLLFTSSTLVHSFPPGKAKDIFEIFVHSSIYFFIAGTYMSFLFIAVKGLFSESYGDFQSRRVLEGLQIFLWNIINLMGTLQKC